MQTSLLVRPRLRLVGGVCAGFAEHTGIPVQLVRAATVLLVLCGGSGALLYAWLWATAPDERDVRVARLPKAALTMPDPDVHPDPARPASARPASVQPASARLASVDPASAPPAAAPLQPPAVSAAVSAARDRPVTEVLLGLALLAAGVALISAQLGADVPVAVLVPAIVVLAGTGLAWRQFADLRGRTAGAGTTRTVGSAGSGGSTNADVSGRRGGSPSGVIRALGALVLVALGILLFFVMGDRPDVWTVVVAAASVLIGVGVVVAPWLIRLSRDLVDERAAHEREAERAEIAAHLHDSVLQTLALIQQKAGPQSEAARLARAQERELRGWLFAGEVQPDVDLAEELRRAAAAIEADFAVRFDVVAAGGAVGNAPEPLVAAAREAMLNAARHAGGTVTVFLETRSDAIELIVSDRGPGLDQAAIPADRFGVRESILGRMRRAGGTAVLTSGPGGVGTEVTLRMPATAIDAAAKESP